MRKGNEELFQQLKEVQNQTIKLGDGKSLQVKGVGSVILRSSCGKSNTLTNVQFVPDLAHNLLSVGQLMNSGYTVEFAEGECTIRDDVSKEKVAHVLMTSHRLFTLDANDVGAANVAQGEKETSHLWHKRYGHLNQRSLKCLSECKMVVGLPKITDIEACESCSLGKHKRDEFPVGQARRANTPLELIHADLVGLMRTPSLGGNQYFFLLTDDFSRHVWVYFLKRKSDKLSQFKVF